MDAADSPVVGMDLGSTKFCVGVYRHGKVEIVPNNHGNRTTPSYVAFTDSRQLIGEEAKDQLIGNFQNTVCDVNRLIGRDFEDSDIQTDMKHWPFQVVNDQGKPKIQVSYMGEEKAYFPVEMYSIFLRKMKESAEAYVGKAVTKAVLTIPASFNGAQRQAVRDGATLAGLDVLYLVEEPTAAAIAYALEKKIIGPKNALIVNLGGGTVGVSIVTIDHGSFEVQSTAGDNHLGGVDIDERIMEHGVGVMKSFGKDISTNKLALCRRRIMGERAKCTFSSSFGASMESKSLTEDDGGDFQFRSCRDWFEELNEDLFLSMLKPVKEALKDAKMNKSQIDEIVLVGGSSDIPKVRELIEEFFNGKELLQLGNSVEAAAYGASILSAVLQGDKTEELKDVSLTDVAPVSLVVNMDGGESRLNLIKRNTSIPAKIVKKLFTSRENQSKMVISMCEGERGKSTDSFLFRQFQLTGIPRAPSGMSIEMTFIIDQNFCLDVIVAHKSIRVTELAMNNNHQ